MAQNLISPSYTFTPGAAGVGTLNLSGISGFSIKRLVAVVNITRGVVIYSPVNPATNVASTTLTLGVDTSTHNSGDTLWIKYESSQSDNLQVGGVDVSLASPMPVFPRPRFIVAAAAAMTRPANTTAYAALDAVSNNATAGSVAAISLSPSDTNDDPVAIERLRILSTDTGPGTAGATFRAWLFSSDPTASSGVGGGDNAAFSQKQAGFIGTMSGTFRAFSDGSGAVLAPDEGAEIITLPSSGAKTVFVLLQTLTAFTPSANSTTFTVTIEGVQGRA